MEEVVQWVTEIQSETPGDFTEACESWSGTTVEPGVEEPGRSSQAGNAVGKGVLPACLGCLVEHGALLRDESGRVCKWTWAASRR